MAINFSSIFAAIIAEGPSLFADIEAEFEAIAHGEGGVQKVANAAQGLAVIASAVAKGAVAVAGQPAPTATPPTPQT